MGSLFASSQFALAFAMGVSAYIGIVHLWMGPRREGGAAHFWVAFFALGAFAFQLARYVQIDTSDPQVALASARWQVALAPILILSLFGLARTLGPRPWSLRSFLVFSVWNASLGLAALKTGFFVPKVDGVRMDWFGASYIAAPGGPALGLLMPYILASFAYIARELSRSPELAREERRALVLSIGVYAAFGVLSVLSAVGAVSFPLLAPYGPLVMALGLNYMLLHRHQRQRIQLEATAAERARALGESEARYSRLVDAAPVGIIACRGNGRLVAVNRRMLEILGAPPGAELTDSGQLSVLPDDRIDVSALLGTRLALELQQCIATGESARLEASIRTRWGKAVDLRLNAAVLLDATGVITGAQAIVEDVSERKRLEDQLRQWQKMEAVGHLAAGIAHEINNPMAYVRTNLKLLAEECRRVQAEGHGEGDPAAGPAGGVLEASAAAVPEDWLELIDESLEGVDRTIAIVRDVKDFARSGEARNELADLGEVVESSLRVATSHLGAGVSIERQFSELPALSCSPGQLRQVFLNLLVNAIHAVGGSGVIRVSTRLESGAAVVEVSDDGGGISPEAQEHLFDPFFTTKPTGEGTGLGLYISYEIVRRHGGEIRVQSSPGAGATFAVHLPLAAKRDPEPG